MLDPHYARLRQQRLLQVLRQQNLDAIVLADPAYVYYFTTFQTNWLQQSCFVLLPDGQSWLLSGNQVAPHAVADEKAMYEAQWMATQRSDQPAAAALRVTEFLLSRPLRRIGLDASPVSSQLAIRPEFTGIAVDEFLFDLRRVKDPDELALLKKAISCTGAMYRLARQIIEPGISELTVFTQLQQAAIQAAGEQLSPQHLGNDYASGKGGGSPRADRHAQAGQIYLLDLGPAFRGYFSDNCRAFCVDRKPTDAQWKAWEGIVQSHRIVTSMARAGVRCRDLFQAVDDHFRATFGVTQKHHLGHGIGLHPHEAPHLNPRWDDTLREGEVIAVEPGVYSVEINNGIRIEQDYLVGNNGLELLSDFPIEMV